MGDDGREMIPLKLTLSNFLCYRDDVPPLDLEGIHIACLCGENGHGKSALLDAITFALWGSSRLGDNRNHDDLIHKGQRNMFVDLEFESAGDRYRVVRRRTSRRSQGVTDLQLFIQNESGGWLAVTGNTVRDTQALITERIRLDHETFVNTAFLRQGDADHFTTSSASDRKRILAEVLDLSYYDGLEARAREKSSGLREQAQRLESEVEVREREVARRPGLETDLAQVSRRIGAIGLQLSEARSELDASSRAVSDLVGKKTELDGLTPRIAGVRTQTTDARERAAQYRDKVGKSEALIARGPEIEEGYKRLASAQDEEARLTRALVSKNRLDGLLAAQEQAIAVEAQRLAARREQLAETAADLSARSDGVPALKKALADLEPERDRLGSIEQRIAEDGVRERSLRGRLEASEGLRRRYDEIQARLSEARTAIAIERGRLESDAGRIERRIEVDLRPQVERLDALLKERERLEGEAAELASDGHIDERRAKMQEMESRAAALNSENERLRQTMEDTRKKFDLLDAGDAECPLCGQGLEADGREHLRAEYEELGRTSAASYRANTNEMGDLEQRGRGLKSKIQRLESGFRRKQQELHSRQGKVAAQIDQGRKAKLDAEVAGRELAEVRSRLDSEAYAEDHRRSAAESLDALNRLGFDPQEAERLAQEHLRMQEGLRSAERELSRGTIALQGRESALQRDLKDAREAGGRLGPVQDDLAVVSARIESGDFAQDARGEVERLSGEIAALGYDGAAHKSAQDSVRELGRFGEQRQQLDGARGQIEWDRAQLGQAESDSERLRRDLETMEERRTRLAAEVEGLPEAEARRARHERRRDDLDGALGSARVEKGVLEEAIARCERLAGEVVELKRQRGGCLREQSLYQELALAFGKNGIQALIIEDAIPQLDSDANELLGRLTDNRMSLRLELGEGRRVRGTDAPSEELRINIADEMGTRAYETFSGGEAFRINFALRIALSRLLARRSGAPLPVLFIDEGFGSQDAGGQQRLVEAIQSIRSDFDKIIVITHIDAIKEAFDTRIQVEKTEMGSRYEVVWG